MVHKGTDASGMEESRCPVCGRHFIVRWPPTTSGWCWPRATPTPATSAPRREPGLSGIQVAPTAAPDEDDWRRWLRDNGIDWDDPVA